MRFGAVQEVRRSVRRWYLWVLPPLVAVFAWRLLSLNAQFAEYFLNDDPQSPGERLENYRTDLMAMHTSGLGAGQWLALLAGVLVTVHDRQPANEVELARRLVAKVSVVAPYGLLLAAVDLAVALPAARSALRSHWGPTELASAGISPDQQGWPLWTVAAGALSLPLWAVAGVGLGMLLGTWRRLVAVALGHPLMAVLAWALAVQVNLDIAIHQLLFFVLLAPAVVWALLVLLLVHPGLPLVALGITFVLAVLVLLVGYDVARRRLAHLAKARGAGAGALSPGRG
jgi:hypothetical protein